MKIIKSSKAVTNSDIEFLAEAAANVTTDKELNDVLSSLKLVDEKLWREMCDAYDSGKYSPAYIGKDISDILILDYLPRDVESCDKVSSSEETAVSSSTGIYGSSSNIENEVYDAAMNVMLSSEFGFDPDELADYLFVESKQVGGSTVVEIRAEVSYDGLEKLCDACNPIVQKYDPSSYFEPVEPGIAQAWIGDAYVQSSKYGGAFDIDDEEFFTRDEINEWGDAVVDKFNETMKTSFVLESVYCESSSLELNITDYDYTLSTIVKVDMRRIRRPSDINKYIDTAVTSLIQEYKDNVEG